MTDSTRRALRTAYQTIVALLSTIPILLGMASELLPADSPLGAKVAAAAVSILAGIAVVTKVLNALEDAGILPAWLKGDTTIPAPATPDGAHVITDLPAPSEGVDAGATPPVV